MPSFKQAVVDVLYRRGPMDVRALVRVANRLCRLRRSEENLVADVLQTAIDGRDACLMVSEYPVYRLRSPRLPRTLPTGKYAKFALLALRDEQSLSLPALTERYIARYKSAARSPEFWMWQTLSTEVKQWVASEGGLRVDITQAKRKELDETQFLGGNSAVPIAKREPLLAHLDERSLETLLATRLNLLEPGLTLFQRQCRIPVGIIDLLCLDANRNYVVVELKRPSADFREIVGQITSYMGWVRKNIAKVGQDVRGIIVVGKPNEKLDYAAGSVPNLMVRSVY